MTTITLDVPDQLAKRLKKFEPTVLIEVLRKVLDMLDLLTAQSYKLVTKSEPISTNTCSWQEDLNDLRQQIRDDGGLKISSDLDEMIETLRQIRYEIFEEEYAHLYR
jgi:hypothetical protein